MVGVSVRKRKNFDQRPVHHGRSRAEGARTDQLPAPIPGLATKNERRFMIRSSSRGTLGLSRMSSLGVSSKMAWNISAAVPPCMGNVPVAILSRTAMLANDCHLS